jgi:hypothetical protein
MPISMRRTTMSNNYDAEPENETDEIDLVPDGLPEYLGFRPRPDTIQCQIELERQLQQIDRKLATSNHLQAHTMLKDLILPAFLALVQRVTCSERDLLEHTNNLASYLATQTPTEEGIPDEIADPIVAHLNATCVLLENVLKLLAKPEDVLNMLLSDPDATRKLVLDPNGVVGAFVKEAQQLVTDSRELVEIVNEARIEEEADESDEEALSNDGAVNDGNDIVGAGADEVFTSANESASTPAAAGADDGLFEEG